MPTYNFQNFQNKSIREIVEEFVVIRGDLMEPSVREFFIALLESRTGTNDA